MPEKRKSCFKCNASYNNSINKTRHIQFFNASLQSDMQWRLTRFLSSVTVQLLVLKNLLEVFLKLMAEIESEELVSALEEIVNQFKEDIPKPA